MCVGDLAAAVLSLVCLNGLFIPIRTCRRQKIRKKCSVLADWNISEIELQAILNGLKERQRRKVYGKSREN